MEREHSVRISCKEFLEGIIVDQELSPQAIKTSMGLKSLLYMVGISVYKDENSFLLDDGTGIVVVRTDYALRSEEVVVGKTYLVIGRPRRIDDERFVSAIIVRRIDPLWMKYHRKMIESRKLVVDDEEEVVVNHEAAIQAMNEHEFIEEVLGFIRDHDSGPGVGIEEVSLGLGKSLEEVRSAIDVLLKTGQIFEYRDKRYKIV